MTAGRAQTWVALLRGINVGRNKRVAMADLRALLESIGYGDVRTLLQSGNAVFTTPNGQASAIEAKVGSRIKDDLGLAVKVLVRPGAELDAIVEANPFPARDIDAKQLHVAFLSGSPPAEALKNLDPERLAPDEFTFGDRVIYLRLPNGVQGSGLPDWERLLGLDVTVRNWNTVNNLRNLVAGRV